MAIFLDEATPALLLESIIGISDDEEVQLGRREVYGRYGASMATSRLRIPATKTGTGRNMNTVAAQ